MSDKTIEELESWQDRLERDIRQIKMIDNIGPDKNSPLVRNLEQCKKDINTLKEAKK